MTRNDSVVLSSLPCGAAIMACGIMPTKIERGLDGRFAFVFPPSAEPLTVQYMTGKLKVDAQEMMRRFDQLRDIVRRRYDLETVVTR